MPRRKKTLLPTRLGKCSRCGKDIYPDKIGAGLALEVFARNPKRGKNEPIRFYPCPVHPGFHLTSEEQQAGIADPVAS